MIRGDQLTRVYRTKHGDVCSLDGLNLEVKPGEFVALRGPSGCGKTTLLLTLGGMLRPTSGHLRVNGQDLYALDARQRARFRAETIGFVFQMFHLIPYLSVLENVLLAKGSVLTIDNDSPPLPSRRPPRVPQAASDRARQLLDQLGLGPRLHHKPGELSAGEKQRAALARALLNGPKLILADEPTGNLDPDNAAEVFRHLREFHQRGGTVLVVTHGTQAEAYAQRTLRMEAGQVRARAES